MCVWYKEFDILIFFFCFCISHAEHMHTIHELADNINIFAILMCVLISCVLNQRLNLAKLGSDSLWRYCRHFNLVSHASLWTYMVFLQILLIFYLI
jgi:hypothetical protein